MNKFSVESRSTNYSVTPEGNTKPQEINISSQGLIEKLGSRKRAIEYFEIQIANGLIKFPYHASYLDSPEVMFNRLIKYNPLPVVENYQLKSFYCDKRDYVQQSYLCNSKREKVYLLSDLEEHIDFLSDHYIEDIRLDTYRPGWHSVNDYWYDHDLRQQFLNKLLDQPTINTRTMREVLSTMTFESKAFRPTWAKGLIYLTIGNQPGHKILDISAGWGDRLLTAMATGNEYLGFDPNVSLKPRHQNMIDSFYGRDNYSLDANNDSLDTHNDGAHQTHSADMPYQIIYQPFEITSIKTLKNFAPSGFDLVLSSPPFFSVEIYPDDTLRQSTDNFSTLDQWLSGFLYPSLNLAWLALRVGGYFAIHLGDTYEIRITSSLLHHLKKIPDARFLGIIGVSGKRGKARPVFIWRKA